MNQKVSPQTSTSHAETTTLEGNLVTQEDTLINSTLQQATDNVKLESPVTEKLTCQSDGASRNVFPTVVSNKEVILYGGDVKDVKDVQGFPKFELSNDKGAVSTKKRLETTDTVGSKEVIQKTMKHT